MSDTMNSNRQEDSGVTFNDTKNPKPVLFGIIVTVLGVFALVSAIYCLRYLCTLLCQCVYCPAKRMVDAWRRIKRREKIRKLKVKLIKGINISPHMAVVYICSKCWKDTTLEELSKIKGLEGMNIDQELLNNSGKNGTTRFVYVCIECDEFEWNSFKPKKTTIPFNESLYSQFVSNVYEDIKLLDDRARLSIEHEMYIKSNIVKQICNKLGELFDIFKLERDVLPNGSYYQKTKLFYPDEFDYLVPLKLCKKLLRGDNTIQLQNRNFCHNILRECEKLDPGKAERKILDEKWRLASWIMYYIHKAIDKTLKCLHEEQRLTYKGIMFIGDKRAKDSGLAKDEVILDDELHGPCIRLRVGAELCATDIDIGFCVLKKPPTGKEIYNVKLMLPGSEFWIQSAYYEHSRMDEHHRKLVMILKYIMSVCNKDGSCLTNLSSHAFKCLVYAHQKECRDANNTSFGRCLYDILDRISRLICLEEWNVHFEFKCCCQLHVVPLNNRNENVYQPLLTNDKNTYDACRQRRWIGKLPDVDSGNKNLLKYSPWLMDQLFVRVLFKWFGESLISISEESTGEEYRKTLEDMCAKETHEFVNKLGDKYKSCQDPFEVLKRLQGKHFRESKDHSVVNIDSSSSLDINETFV